MTFRFKQFLDINDLKTLKVSFDDISNKVGDQRNRLVLLQQLETEGSSSLILAILLLLSFAAAIILFMTLKTKDEGAFIKVKSHISIETA